MKREEPEKWRAKLEWRRRELEYGRRWREKLLGTLFRKRQEGSIEPMYVAGRSLEEKREMQATRIAKRNGNPDDPDDREKRRAASREYCIRARTKRRAGERAQYPQKE